MSQRKGAKPSNGPPSAHMEAGPTDKFSVRGFRPYRQWAVDCDYLRGLPPSERAWMKRFLAEYYDADNKLLRPEQHESKCPTCRKGGDCGKRPTQALHATDDLRRECYRRQNYAYYDAHSRGLVNLWEDFNSVDTEGHLPRTTSIHASQMEALRPRVEVGDFDDGPGGTSTNPQNVMRRVFKAKR